MEQRTGPQFPRQGFDNYCDSNNVTDNRIVIDECVSQSNGQRPRTTFTHINDQQLNSFWANINKELLISKIFYFFFFSAFGSLFPLMAVYFKQLGMNAIQAGSLIGIRPFIEFLSAPFWSSLADRFHKCKVILLFSLISWIVFTFSLAFIRPPASACVIFNETHHILYTPYSEYQVDEEDNNNNQLQQNRLSQLNDRRYEHFIMKRDNKEDEDWIKKSDTRHKPPPTLIVGKSPLTVEYTLNYNQEKHISYVSPPFSTIVYKLDDVKEVFFLLLLLILLGEFFSAPAITLADCATLTYLGENTDDYGRQRMFGSFGWGITMFFVGIALDYSTKFTNHPCGPHIGERNYVTCFTVFALLMAGAFLAATQFHFDYDSNPESSVDEIHMKQYDYEGSGPRPWLNTAPPINKPNDMSLDKKFEFIENWKSAVFAQRTRELPQWVTVLRSLANIQQAAFLFVTWFMGFGIGLVFTFLFWHLQDLGGTPTLFGLASVINHLSEVSAYFFSFNFIKHYGHTKVLCIGLIGNVARFLYISWLENPWWVLPFETFNGVTHAAVWAAACSYITQHTEPQLRSSTQGVLQGVHHGLGRGCGSIIGGIFVNRFGTQITFRLYGLLCLAVLAFFVHVNYYRKNEGYKFYEEQKENVVFEDSSAHLAPHGVPTNPIARSLSRQNFQQNSDQQLTQKEQQENSNTNPFKTEDIYSDPNNAWNQPFQTQLNLGNFFNLISPEGNWDLGNIRRHFKLLSETTSVNNDKCNVNEDVMYLDINTTIEAPQPIIECDSTYDW